MAMNNVETIQGWIQEVHYRSAGGELIEDALSGATQLQLDSVDDFNDDGGTLTVDLTTSLQYVGRDADNELLTLAAPLGSDILAGALIDPEPATQEKVAEVLLTDNPDPIEATIPHDLAGTLNTGVRDDAEQESVDLIMINDEYYIEAVQGRQTVLLSELLDTVPEPTAIAPTVTPDPVVMSGIKLLYATWTPTDGTAGKVRVHISTASFVPVKDDPTTLVKEVNGTGTTIETMPDGTALVQDTIYYVALIAYNAAGDATPSNAVPGSLKKLTTEDISAAAAWIGTLAADKIIAGDGIIDDISVLGALTAHGANGEIVSLNGDGFIVQGPDSLGNPVYVFFPTDGGRPNIISGVLQATTLTVDGDDATGQGATFRQKSSIDIGGSLELVNKLPSPTAAPTVTMTARKLAAGPAAGDARPPIANVDVNYDFDITADGHVISTWESSTTVKRAVEYHDVGPDHTQITRRLMPADSDPIQSDYIGTGVAIIGNYAYVPFMAAPGFLSLRVMNAADGSLDLVSRTLTGLTFTNKQVQSTSFANPAKQLDACFLVPTSDGNLYFAYPDVVSVDNTAYLKVVKISPQGTVLKTYTSTYNLFVGNDLLFTGFYMGQGDYGVEKAVVARCGLSSRTFLGGIQWSTVYEVLDIDSAASTLTKNANLSLDWYGQHALNSGKSNNDYGQGLVYYSGKYVSMRKYYSGDQPANLSFEIFDDWKADGNPGNSSWYTAYSYAQDSARSVSGVTVTSGSTQLTTIAKTFDPVSDIRASVSGAGIPAGATITAVASDGLSATMSAAATASSSGAVVNITQHLDTELSPTQVLNIGKRRGYQYSISKSPTGSAKLYFGDDPNNLALLTTLINGDTAGVDHNPWSYGPDASHPAPLPSNFPSGKSAAIHSEVETIWTRTVSLWNGSNEMDIVSGGYYSNLMVGAEVYDATTGAYMATITSIYSKNAAILDTSWTVAEQRSVVIRRPIISLRGNGSGRLGPYGWDADGNELVDHKYLTAMMLRSNTVQNLADGATANRSGWSVTNNSVSGFTNVGNGVWKATVSGFYHIMAKVGFAGQPAGSNVRAYINLMVNGSTVVDADSNQLPQRYSTLKADAYDVPLNAGDTIAVLMGATGAAIATIGDSAYNSFVAIKIDEL